MDVRSLEAIHLATAAELMDDVRELVTYDVRMADAARGHGLQSLVTLLTVDRSDELTAMRS